MEKQKDIQHRQAYFLGKFLHEIRNSLTAAFSAAEAIKTARSLSDNDKLLLLTAIQDSCRKAEMDLVKLRTWKLYLEPLEDIEMTKTDLRTVMAELFESYSKTAEEADKKMEYIEKINNKPAFIACDQKYLILAIGSLIENAIHFSDRNQVIRVALMKSHTEYVIEILDQGHGIQEKDFPHILDPYYSKDPRGGFLHQESLGLGLTVSKRIVEMHGGILDIRSKFNRGTVVFLHFPALSK
jgi:signal transduction histidine kinase